MKRIVCIVCFVLLLCLAGCAKPPEAELIPDTPAPTATARPTATPAPTPTATPTIAPVPVTLYLPDASGTALVAEEGTIAEDSAVAIIDELVRREALPDVDYGRNLYFSVGDSFVKVRNRTRVPRIVARLDVSDAFLRALEDMTKAQELMTLQCLANTFITRYDAEVFMLTVEGVKLETRVRDYEKGIEFDQYVKTRAG